MEKFYAFSVLFSDLNVYIEKNIVDIDVCYRLFGESQYYWFAPLIKEVREVVGDKANVRWTWETQLLEEKFEKIRATDKESYKRRLAK
ncbi:hypothetical protein [Aliikangiella sp. IMCC44359]|uniref:hypothetical protein n=1 Tax=Aliikangiella sp. IMCC44359 TaxID=3459125 RepID=UPI00403ACB8E